MTHRLAATALRLLAPRATAGVNPADGDDLANLVSDELPNHAMCWAGGSLFDFDRDDSSSAALQLSGSAGGVVVVPNSGPGRWKAMAGAAVENADQVTSATATGDIVVAAPQQWSPMVAAHAWSGLANRWWSAGSNIGVITYNGPSGLRWLVNISLAVINTLANLTQARLAASIDGASIGTTANLNVVGLTGVDNTVGRQISVTAMIQPNQGSTLQPIFASDNGDDMTLIKGVMTVVPIL